MATPLALAKRPHSPAATQAIKRQFLAFMLGGEAFAMDIRSIKEVLSFESLTEVPLLPPVVRGVVNLRGAVMPVLDLQVRFGRERTTISRRTCIVVVEAGSRDQPMDLGVLVDQVSEVLEIGEVDLEPVPSFGLDLAADLLAGVAKVSGRFVVLLDATRALAVEDLGHVAASLSH